MKCTIRFSRLQHFFTYTALMLTVLALLPACTESIRKVSHAPYEQTSQQAMTSQDTQSPLEDMTSEELVDMGFIYLENQNFTVAKLHFSKALEKNPKLARAYVGLGRVEMFNDRCSEAMVLFNRASEIAPDLVPALIGQAQALRCQGKLSAAIEKINAAMLVAPEDLSVLNELATIYDQMGRESLAQPLYREIVQKAPDVAESHNNLGMNQMVQGQYPEAILSFLQALALDQDNTRIKNNLAAAYALHGDQEKALQIFTSTVGEAAAYNNLGYLYMTQGHFSQAEIALKKAIDLNPKFYVKAQENLERLRSLRSSKQ